MSCLEGWYQRVSPTGGHGDAGEWIPFKTLPAPTGLPETTTSRQIDAYGNATQVTVTTGDGHSKTTTNTYQNDITLWYLGRLLRSQVQSNSP